MKKTKILICAFFVTLILVFSTFNVFASTPIDPQKDSSMTFHYVKNDIAFSGLEIKTYRIADVFENGTYELSGEFKNYNVTIYGITSKAEWNNVCSTLASYAVADNLSPTAVKQTNENGVVIFDEILPGMYLTLGVNVENGGDIVVFESFLSVVPYPSENGEHEYDISAFPKSTVITPKPDEIEHKIVKQWKDEGYEQKRPENVIVDIYKDGVFQFTQKLNSKNNWSYSWKTADDGSQWNGVEREVDEMYTVTVVKNGNTIVITNVCEPGDPDTPSTGDTYSFWKYFIIMGFSGVMLLVFSFWRRRNEE